MPRLIDADALKEHIADVPTWTQMREGEWRPKKYPAGMYDPEDVMSSIEIAPTIDAEPVRHGRWDEIPNTYMSVASKDGSYSGNATSCSVCHEVNPNAYKTNYCPTCGAKMDGGASND